jgi:hypothetical protein
MEGDMQPYAFLTSQNRAVQANIIAKFMNKRSVADARAALAVLIGTVAGTTATATYPQIQGSSGPQAAVPRASSVGDMGGVRPIATVTQINRATTAADITELKKWFSNALLESAITYPTAVGLTQGGNQVGGTGRF